MDKEMGLHMNTQQKTTSVPTEKGERAMLKRCSNCKHCKADMRAILLVGIHRRICFSHGHLVRSPFWEGWKCKQWEKEDYHDDNQ